jgi:hypothetical protein
MHHMKRFIAAAAFAVAAVPAVAGAVPPGNSSLPLGSTSACAIAAAPAGPVPGKCSFRSAGDTIGYAGASSGGFTLTHQQKVNKCVAGKTTADLELKTVTDASGGAGPFYDGPDLGLRSGVVYTFTVLGGGWAIAGGQGTPGQDMSSDPTVGAAPGYAGAEDATTAVGTAC